MPNKIEYHIPVETDGLTAVELLADKVPVLSKQKIKQAMQKGCVWLEKDKYIQRLRRSKKALSKDETLHFYYNPEVLEATPPKATLISDEGDYSIWNKPSGMLSQGSKWGDHCTIYRWAEKELKPERPAFIVHRLDRAASGLIIIAHKKKIAAKFSKMFQDHEVEKHYHVIVDGDFSTLFFDTDTDTESGPKTMKTISTELDGKSAISHIRPISFDKEIKQSQLDVEIETGRKHQIRKHLSELGFPVIGDRLYGGKVEEGVDLQLTAMSLKFICPVTDKERKYELNGLVN